MPPKPRLSLPALAGLVAALSGCALDPVAATPTPAPAAQVLADPIAEAPSQPLQTDEARAQYHVLAGELAAGRNLLAQAAREFLAALQYMDDASLAQRATVLAVSARDDKLAMQAAQRWLELEPESADPREVVASLSLRAGELAGAHEQVRELVKRHPGGPADGLLHAAQILTQAGRDRADGALSIMQQLVAESPELAGAHHALGVLALHYRRLDLAEAAVRKAQSLEPGNRDHTLLLIGIWAQDGRIDEADARLESLAAGAGDAVDLRMGYAKLLLDNGERDAARRQLERILKVDKRNVDAHYALGVLAFNEGDHAAAVHHLEPLLDGQRRNEAAMQLGRIAEAQQRYPEALDYYARIGQGPAALDAATRRAFVLGRMGRLPEARGLLQALGANFPQYADRFLLAEGELLLEAGDNQAALATYSDALARDPGNIDLLYGRSLAYERLKNIDMAEQDLRRVLEQEPDDARALNALGYMLVVHTTRMSEAESAIKRAIELEPDDAAIIDSMGWLQYKLGRPEAALDWLKKAYAQLPDPEVAAHLGEVLWVLNEREQARAVWDAALRNDPEHPALLETMRRLTP